MFNNNFHFQTFLLLQELSSDQFETYLFEKYQIHKQFTEKLFSFCDLDKNGSLSLEEVAFGLAHMCELEGSDAQSKFIFDLYDDNGDKKLNLAELTEVIEMCTRQSPEDSRRIAQHIGMPVRPHHTCTC